MSAEILKETLISVVAIVAQHVGFERTSLEAVDVLSEVLYKYLKSVSKSITDVACMFHLCVT